MQLSTNSRALRQACGKGRGCRTLHRSRVIGRGLLDQEGFAPDAFKQALEEALHRDTDTPSSSPSSPGPSSGGRFSSYINSRPAGSESSSYGSSDSRYSTSSSTSGGYSSPPSLPVPPVNNNSVAAPLLSVIATALKQSRTTLQRLQAEEAEIEDLVQKQQKQVERLQWLLEKVQQDYAYYNQLDRMHNKSRNGSSYN